MIIRLLISLAIKLFIDIPMTIAGLFIVPIGLRFGFRGLLWPWGNDDHPDNGGEFWRNNCGSSWWCAYQWFALRNSAFNMSKYVLGFVSTGKARRIAGTHADIGDADGEGWYWCRDSWAWELYYIKAYGSRCIRVRIGWKLDRRKAGDHCQFCFVISPFKAYTGIADSAGL